MINTLFKVNNYIYQHPALEIMESFTMHIVALQKSRNIHEIDAWFQKIKYTITIFQQDLEKYNEKNEPIYNWEIQLQINFNNSIAKLQIQNVELESCCSYDYDENSKRNFVYNKDNDVYILNNVLQRTNDYITITISRTLSIPENITVYL
jgi:hypothetical protein